MACSIDSWVPTPSMTECAPSPLVSSLIRATPSSPRSSTISVAPYSRASCWRGAWRLMAMIRSAPSCLAASTASSPTAPSPTTATILPGPASAAEAANQPVPSTSEAASKLGIRSSAGRSGGATNVPSASGTRSSSALGPQGPPGAPGGGGPLDGFDPPVRPQVRAADTGRGQPEDGVGWLDDPGVLALLHPNVAGGIEDSTTHDGLLGRDESWRRRRSGRCFQLGAGIISHL